MIRLIAAVAIGLAVAPAFAQTKPGEANTPEAAAEPEQSSLMVGAMQIGSAPNLVIAGIDINVARDAIVYSYFLQNTGTTELAIAAVVTLPELQASADRSQTWRLASSDPENPIGLTITAAGAPVTTKAEVHAHALGVDRLAEIKVEHLPLIPFGSEVDKALAALSPETATRLAALGIVSPRDPAQPKTPMSADWSLDVARTWRQILPAGKTTPIIVKFTPVLAQYRLVKGDEDELDDLKDDLCLKPQVLNALKSRLKGGGAWKVTDISLSTDAPAHWIDSPNPSLSVQRPSDATVAFCGMEDKTANKSIVFGTTPDDAESIRILMFEPAAK